jgi:nucleoside-diphosphate-sugar epimerase
VRILLTGATGAIGRLVARHLIAAGHSVSGIAQRPHDCLPAQVNLVCARLRDPILHDLAEDADAVIHLAPVDTSAPGGEGINGVAHVTHAAARAGARLLFVSQAAGQPDLYRPAETLVSTSWGPSLVIRVAPPVGRQLDWMVCRTVATLLRAKVSERPMRVLHLDDLVRFLVAAVSTDRTGVVDLATPDTTNMVTAWRLLRSVDSRSRVHRVRSWPELFPTMDTAETQEDWPFEFGWQASEAVIDTGRGLVGRRLGPAGATHQSGQLALPVEPPPPIGPSDGLQAAAPDGLEGEFDDRIDPRFPVFSATSLAEALPGPLTPITLDVQISGLRAASRAMGQVLALGGVVGDEWGSRAIAVFGHRPYVGVSANVVAATQLPGWDQQTVTQRALGDQQQATEVLPFGRPQLAGGPFKPVAKAVVAARSLALVRHLRAETQAYGAASRAEHLDAGQLAALPDAGLQVRIPLLRDRIHQGWILTALWVIDSGVTAAALQHTSASGHVSGVSTITESGRIAAETATLAEVLRRDPQLFVLARTGDLAGLRVLFPHTADNFDESVTRIGHRGPGEAELASPVFADNAAMLLIAAAQVAQADGAPARPPATMARRLADSARGSRELAHDTTLRFTHELRMALRELGSRRVAADLIDFVDDVYYLTCDEAVTMPADARLRIKRRRTERDRLQAQHPPDVIERAWTPD